MALVEYAVSTEFDDFIKSCWGSYYQTYTLLTCLTYNNTCFIRVFWIDLTTDHILHAVVVWLYRSLTTCNVGSFIKHLQCLLSLHYEFECHA